MSLASIFNIISITILISANATVWTRSKSCYPRVSGIQSIERSPDNILGRYELKLCSGITNHLSSIGTLFVEVEYMGDYEENNCNFIQQKPVLHSMLEIILEDLYKCPVVCQDITLDLIVNGCYNITFGIVDSDFNILSKHTTTQYIKDSKDLQYFNAVPSVSIFYDHRKYISITWDSGNIPITSYTFSECPSKNFNLDTDLENCNYLDYCDNINPYTIMCSTSKPKKIYGYLEPQLLVFQHKDVPWDSGMFSGLSTAIYTLDRNFDLNGSNIITGTATYLNPDPEVTTLTAEITTETLNTEKTSESESTTAIPIVKTTSKPIEDEKKEGARKEVETKKIEDQKKEGSSKEIATKSFGGGFIIACVVIVVLIVVMALVLRTLYLRGHFRRYFNFR